MGGSFPNHRRSYWQDKKAMQRRVIVWIWVMIIGLHEVNGQDFHYSQFFAAPLNLNPAFAGSVEKTRIGVNYRKQWPGLEYSFNGYSAYVDHYSFDLKSGFGLLFNSFNEDNMNLRSTEVGFFYSYNLQVAENLNIRFGNQTSFVTKRGDLSGLLYGDQIDVFNKTILSNTLDNLDQFEPFSYLDISFGFLMTARNFWFGASGYHLNDPKMWYVTERDFEYLPQRYAAHAGVRFDLAPHTFFGSQQNEFITLMASYKQQGTFNQLDIMSQVIYQSYVFGLGYRGIPQNNRLPNADSAIFLLGFTLDSGMTFGYSYDWALSEVSSYTRGSHEVSIRYQFLWGNPKDRNRRQRILQCFDYF